MGRDSDHSTFCPLRGTTCKKVHNRKEFLDGRKKKKKKMRGPGSVSTHLIKRVLNSNNGRLSSKPIPECI